MDIKVYSFIYRMDFSMLVPATESVLCDREQLRRGRGEYRRCNMDDRIPSREYNLEERVLVT
jgi:hypothetical protein